MKKTVKNCKTEWKELNPQEMLQIRGGAEKPKDPKAPDESIILI